MHFLNARETSGSAVRNVHVFKDYVDTVYAPPSSLAPSTKEDGKLNHFEVTISQQGVEARDHALLRRRHAFRARRPSSTRSTPPCRSPGDTFSCRCTTTPRSSTPRLPTRSMPRVARIDNVGFDGPVRHRHFREYEVPNALVKFSEHLGGPLQPRKIGYDVGYALQDAAEGAEADAPLSRRGHLERQEREANSFSAWMNSSRKGRATSTRSARA